MPPSSPKLCGGSSYEPLQAPSRAGCRRRAPQGEPNVPCCAAAASRHRRPTWLQSGARRRREPKTGPRLRQVQAYRRAGATQGTLPRRTPRSLQQRVTSQGRCGYERAHAACTPLSSADASFAHARALPAMIHLTSHGTSIPRARACEAVLYFLIWTSTSGSAGTFLLLTCRTPART